LAIKLKLEKKAQKTYYQCNEKNIQYS